MFFPIGSEKISHILPTTTITLILLNCVIFLVTHPIVKEEYQEIQKIGSELITAERTIYLKSLQARDDEAGKGPIPIQSWFSPVPEDFRKKLEEGDESVKNMPEYEEWQRVKSKFDEAMKARLFYRFGFRTGSRNPLLLITSIFLHAGYFHLLGNMLFLWIVGVNIESVWGAKIFLFIYFLGGVLATITHSFFMKDEEMPLIGASGAIACIMGAYLIRHFKTKIYFYNIFIYVGKFSVKAGYILPVWLLLQVKGALTSPGSSGVAFWAHIGGFGAGTLLASIYHFGKVEEHLAPAMKKKEIDSLRERYRTHMDRQQEEEGFQVLSQLIERDPENVGYRKSLISHHMKSKNFQSCFEETLNLLELLWKEGRREDYQEIYRSVLLTLREPDQIPPSVIFKAASCCQEKRMFKAAAEEFYKLHKVHPDDPLSPRALVSYARILSRIYERKKDAEKIYRYVLERYPDCDLRDFIKEELLSIKNSREN